MKFRSYAASMALAAMTSLVIAIPAKAQATIRIDLPGQDLATSLRAIARQSGLQIMMAADVVEGRKAAPISGEFTPQDAVRRVIARTGIAFRIDGDTILVGAVETRSERQIDTNGASDITVTGSRIAGAAVASPVITIGRQDILNGGYADLGSAMRAVPQNFAGGQNPGVASGANAGGQANQNITGGSAVNLRGLGGDATLTLLDGNRLSYGGFSQGIDISAIPLEAIERIDIVPDGASAIYGSDAVAGVVNVVLRSDLDGVSSGARIGTATDGGYFTQRYSLVGGQRWATGSVLAGYTYSRNTDIQARQRSFTAELGDDYMLYPEQHAHSAILRATQDLGANVHLGLDGLFNRRENYREITAYGLFMTDRIRDRLFSVAPSVDVDLSRDWRLSFRGAYSEDRAISAGQEFFEGEQVYEGAVCYCNSLYGGEAYLEGDLFTLPGGAVKLVAGGGYRANRFANYNLLSGNGTRGTQTDTYGYGELFVPIIGTANAAPLARALSLTLAGRYDRYNGFGGIATPKLGVIYSPLDGLDLKFSWGRSFKAPTLFQQNQARSATLIDAATLVGADVPAGASALYTEGGAPALRPERATSLSWTASFKPIADSGLAIDLTYFRVKYSDRVLKPIGNYLNALNPAYADFVLRNPTLAQVEQAIASSATGLQYYGGITDDLSQVAYIIDNHYTNVANQKIQGIDASVSYREPLGSGEVSTSITASWLDSRQQNNVYSGYFDLSGTIWNPSHYRARASLGWEGEHFRAYGYLNHTGALEDRRDTIVRRLGSTVTADMLVGYSFGEQRGAFSNVQFSLSAENVFNAKPPSLRAAAYVEAYDSTNYSPIGRFVAFSILKSI